jgi:hypothetical protein
MFPAKIAKWYLGSTFVTHSSLVEDAKNVTLSCTQNNTHHPPAKLLVTSRGPSCSQWQWHHRRPTRHPILRLIGAALPPPPHPLVHPVQCTIEPNDKGKSNRDRVVLRFRKGTPTSAP